MYLFLCVLRDIRGFIPSVQKDIGDFDFLSEKTRIVGSTDGT